MFFFRQIEKIRLGQDSRGYGKGLFVDNVRIAPTDSDPVNFPCACWLAEDVWDSKTERELLPGKAVKRPESMCFDKYLPVSFHGTALLNREIFAAFCSTCRATILVPLQ